MRAVMPLSSSCAIAEQSATEVARWHLFLFVASGSAQVRHQAQERGEHRRRQIFTPSPPTQRKACAFCPSWARGCRLRPWTCVHGECGREWPRASAACRASQPCAGPCSHHHHASPRRYLHSSGTIGLLGELGPNQPGFLLRLSPLETDPKLGKFAPTTGRHAGGKSRFRALEWGHHHPASGS